MILYYRVNNNRVDSLDVVSNLSEAYDKIEYHVGGDLNSYNESITFDRHLGNLIIFLYREEEVRIYYIR